MVNTASLGKIGEDLACEYLVKKGYKVLKRNYRKPWGEIDIVGLSKNKTLIFFEVKALKERNSEGLLPEDHATASKLEKLRRTCEAFVAKNPELVKEKKGWRIDVIAIALRGDEGPEIRHYENV